MKRITSRTFLTLWYVGALLVGVAVFWTIYIAAPDEVTPNPNVSVNDEPVVLCGSWFQIHDLAKLKKGVTRFP